MNEMLVLMVRTAPVLGLLAITFTAISATILWTTPTTFLRPGPRRAQETRDITVIAFTTAIMLIAMIPMTTLGREYVPEIQIMSAKTLAPLPALMIIMAGASIREPGFHLPAWGCAILIVIMARSMNLAAGTGAMQSQTPLILMALSAHFTLSLTARIRRTGPMAGCSKIQADALLGIDLGTIAAMAATP